MANRIKGRLLTPVDEDGNRTDIHLITTSYEVLVQKEDGTKVLTDVLNNMHTNIEIGPEQPEFPTVWFRTSE